MINVTTISNFRANLKKLLDKVCEDRIYLIIHRERGEDVVVMAKEEWEKIEEINHLMKSPANQEWLKQSIKQSK